MNKKIWITIGIIILVTLSWFFYSASKKQYCWPYCPEMTNEDREEIKESALDASIKDWETYKNDDQGFQFSYPSQLGEITKVSNTKIDCNLGGYYESSLSLTIEHLGVGLACKDRFDPISEFKGGSKKITVGGKESYLFDYTSSTNYHNREVYIPLSDMYYVTLTHSYKNQPGYVGLNQEDFEKMLSTFRFTK